MSYLNLYMVYEKSAGAIVFYRKNNEIYFLLLEYITYWGFVRGKIEKDENIEETIRREAKEEANISDLKFIQGFKEIQDWYYTLDKKTVKKNAIFYLGEITEKQANQIKISDEHKSFKFCTLKEALKLMRIKNEKAMLEKAYNFIIKNS